MMKGGPTILQNMTESSDTSSSKMNPELSSKFTILLFQVGISYMLLSQKDMGKSELVFVKVEIIRV